MTKEEEENGIVLGNRKKIYLGWKGENKVKKVAMVSRQIWIRGKNQAKKVQMGAWRLTKYPELMDGQWMAWEILCKGFGNLVKWIFRKSFSPERFRL